MNIINEDSGDGITLDVMYEVGKSLYNEKMIDICKSLLKDIASNTNPGYPDIWYAGYCAARQYGGKISVDCLSYIIADAKNLSFNRLVNDILPVVKKRDGTFLGWITKQYPAEYYKKLFEK